MNKEISIICGKKKLIKKIATSNKKATKQSREKTLSIIKKY